MNKPNKFSSLRFRCLKISEAGEFGVQLPGLAEALKEEGIRTILINPNIATVQTLAWPTTLYFLPVTPYFVEEVIRQVAFWWRLAAKRR
jgi:carbamoyl-phosphate synthase large subunit